MAPFMTLTCRYLILSLIVIVTLTLVLSSVHHRYNLKGIEPYTMKLLGIKGNAANALVVRSVLRLFSLYPLAMRLDAKSRMRMQENSPPSPDITAFLGDSTFNYWVDLTDDIPRSFNASFGGSRSMDLLRFLDDICLRWYPKNVILHVGGNDWDFRDTTRTYENIVKIIQKIDDSGAGSIVFFTPRAPLYSDTKWKFMSGLRDMLKSNGVCRFIDISSEQLPLSSYIGDGVHFSRSGYRRIANAVLEHLRNDN